MPRSPARGTRRSRRGPRALGCAAVVVLGFAALARLLGGPRRPRRPRPAPVPDATPPPADPWALPEGLAASWLPGPLGPLRVVERVPAEPSRAGVVFVHGLGGRLEHWAGQLAAEPRGVRLAAVDLPGHGGSDAAGPVTLRDLAGSLGAVLDGLGLRRAVVVAHSLGATVAAAYAADHPGRVAGLVLVDPSGDATRLPEAERRAFLAAVRRDPHGELAWDFRQVLGAAAPAVAEEVMAALAAVPGEVLADVLAAAGERSPAADLARWGGPAVALVSPANDLPHSLHRLLPDLPVRRLAHPGHWPHLDHPDDLADLLADFVPAALRGPGLTGR